MKTREVISCDWVMVRIDREDRDWLKDQQGPAWRVIKGLIEKHKSSQPENN